MSFTKEMSLRESVKILKYSEKDIYEVEFLWKKLNLYLQQCSKYFSKEMKEKSFQDRISEICSKDAIINISIAFVDEMKIGYCISKILDGVGEISSIYVENGFRHIGIGSKLMNVALDWLDSNYVNAITINVAVGNEKVLSFYNKFNFFERHLVLKRNL